MTKLLAKAAEMCNLSSLPTSFRISNDLYTLMAHHTSEAKMKGKHAFTYIDLTRDEVLPPWQTPDTVGGVAPHITEEFKLATSPNTAGVMAFYNGINKALQKTRFIRRKEEWLAAFNLGYLLALLATGQMTSVAALIHFNPYASSLRSV